MRRHTFKEMEAIVNAPDPCRKCGRTAQIDHHLCLACEDKEEEYKDDFRYARKQDQEREPNEEF